MESGPIGTRTARGSVGSHRRTTYRGPDRSGRRRTRRHTVTAPITTTPASPPAPAASAAPTRVDVQDVPRSPRPAASTDGDDDGEGAVGVHLRSGWPTPSESVTKPRPSG